MGEADPIIRLNAALEGRYRIERELGAGGMATVYLAEDLKHERKVALKVLKPELAAVVGADRFLAEIKTTANLQHPHILPLHDSGEADGLLFYVMPYVEGESLRDRLDREHQLPVDDAVRIATNLAEALDYAHRQGVIHRDIKPANVLLQDGKPVISDFGIALAVNAAGGGRLTETGLSLGTPHYMSPEQATGDLNVGPATDIYALGCVLYEMLVGEPPFTGSTPQAVLGKIITGEVPSARAERASVPPNVDQVLVGALQKVPADRFGSAGSMASALRDPSFRSTASPHGIGLRSRRVLPSAGLLAVGLAAGIMLRGAFDRPEALPLLHTEIVAPVPARGVGRQSLALPADGSRIVFVGYLGEDLSDRIVFSRPRSDGSAVTVEGTRGATEVFSSPDGEWLAFITDGSELLRVPAAGGSAERVVRLDGAGFLGGSWGPDGRIVYATYAGVYEVSVLDGRTRQWTRVEPTGPIVHRQPSFLPGGEGIILTVTDRSAPQGERDMLATVAASGDVTPFLPGHSAMVTSDGYLVYSASTDGRTAVLSAVPWRAEAPVKVNEERLVLEGVILYTGGGMPSATYALSGGTLIYMSDDVRRRGVIRRVPRGDDPSEVLFDARDGRLPPGVLGFGFPSISPDGTRVAFRVTFDSPPERRVFVFDLIRGTLTPITVDESADGPVWTPDGQQLAFARDLDGDHDLFWKRADNAGVAEPVVPTRPGRQRPMAFAPSGDAILIEEVTQEGTSEDTDIWLLSVGDSGAAVPLRDTPSTERHPSLSPDGDWMVFGSDELGYEQIYVTDVPAGRRLIPVSTEPAFAPIWRGDEIFFFTRGALMVLPVSTAGGDFRPLGPATPAREGGPYYNCCLFGRSHDVGPDGELMVWLGTGSSPGTPRIGVVHGWEALVRVGSSN